MREILFRGKRVDNGEWVEGGIIPLDTESGYVFIAEPFLSASTLPVYEIIKHHTHLVLPETVGQYTGLTDKNGTKIFEGDVIQTRLKVMNFEITFRFVIKHGAYIPQAYCKKEYAEFETIGFYALSLSDKKHIQIGDCPNLYEVVGNIHDNPELLGGGEDA